MPLFPVNVVRAEISDGKAYARGGALPTAGAYPLSAKFGGMGLNYG